METPTRISEVAVASCSSVFPTGSSSMVEAPASGGQVTVGRRAVESAVHGFNGTRWSQVVRSACVVAEKEPTDDRAR